MPISAMTAALADIATPIPAHQRRYTDTGELPAAMAANAYNHPSRPTNSSPTFHNCPTSRPHIATEKQSFSADPAADQSTSPAHLAAIDYNHYCS